MRRRDVKFQAITAIAMVILCIICILPFLLLLSSSLTDEFTLVRNGYSFIPETFSLKAYSYLFLDAKQILRSYSNTLIVTGIGTVINLVLTVLLAYPLSKKDLPGRQIVSFAIFFTMLYNGGVVSTYIMYTQYFHIKNTYFGLLVPNLLMGAFYVIMMRSYFTESVPEEIVEAARIDGAGEWYILAKVVLPISKPIIATISLLVGLQYWNDWINGLYYINKDRYYTIQVLLNNMLKDMQALSLISSSSATSITLPTLSTKMAIAVIGVLPIMVLYPFLQKYLVKGITIGAVKG